MKFFQKENGDCDLVFDDREIEIINNKKKICFTAEGLRHFGNNLVKMVTDWNMKFNKDLQNKSSNSSEVKPDV